MPRLQLTDALWSRLLPVLASCGIYQTDELRIRFEGVLFRLRTGVGWRDLPPEFGSWNSVFKAFNRWSKSKKIRAVFEKLRIEPDTEWAFFDGTIVKAHQHSAGARAGEERGIGKSVAGNTSKIHMAVDGFGLPLNFIVTGGEVHDSKMASELLKSLPAVESVTADKGYDSDEFRNSVEATGAIQNVPRKKNSQIGNNHMDWHLYKCRHLVENIFARLKHNRAIATRYDKLKRNYESIVYLACAMMWLPM
jgi:transposase